MYNTKLRKIFLVAIIPAVFLISCNSGDNETSSISGTYVGRQEFGLGSFGSHMIIELVQNGNTVLGDITPPGSDQFENIRNGAIIGDTIQFERKEGRWTFRYSGKIQTNETNLTITGDFDPLGCAEPSSGESCPSDSHGTFSVTRL